MPKSNLITRTGSKKTDIKHFKKWLPVDAITVVEPFAGGFSVLRDVYFDDNYKKYANDLDPSLFYVCSHPEELKKGFEIWNVINAKDKNSKEKRIEMETKTTEINKHVIDHIIFTSLVRGTLTKTKNLEYADADINFIKKINFSNVDAFGFMEPFLKDKDAFLFLDPPYLFSDNSGYNPQKGETDNTHMYIKFLDILKDKETKAKIMLVINDLKILRWIFKDFIKGDYVRMYQLSNKKMTHLVICNY